jgi:DNA repair photolyase
MSNICTMNGMAARKDDGFRWPTEEDESAGTLFGGPWPERHLGRGEYRGLEFLHVNARSIINEVPPSSRMAFRYTINAYRGCSHACAYCMAGDTPVLMSDGRTKPLADVRVGDQVFGTVRQGRYRRYVLTEVLAHWETVKPAWRVVLEDGTTLLASGDHRFLTRRGWKFVTGAGQGRHRRPHLTTNDKLLGTGRFPEPPTGEADYARGYLCGMVRGDGTTGHYRYDAGATHSFRLALADAEPLVRVADYLKVEGVVTRYWTFQTACGARREIWATATGSRPSVERVEELVRWPTLPSRGWFKGFLAGAFDAEGHLDPAVRISNKDPEMTGWIARSLGELGFRSVVERPGADAIGHVRLLGGLYEVLRFQHTVDPAISRKPDLAGRAIATGSRLRVGSIEPVGPQMPMYDMTTGTGDFIANGVVSHNCFARPTHEFLGLGTGEDFERRIVVKVNAVERARAELSSPRWRGDLIAMGTNTDPYQHAEGKYHLTRGIVGVLSEKRNPFSILTKSTLVLRDLALLAEAAGRTSVRVNLSIGTLDREVWRLTEPGTPPPDKRLEAVRRLNEAGVPCGVLVAPVLPGLSDSDEQVTAVIEACRKACAVGVSVVALHLRPGVREHYLSWLAGVRPDLTGLYGRRFSRGAYQPRQEQQRLSALVGRVMGHRAAPGTELMGPRVAPAAATGPAPEPREGAQMALFSTCPVELEKG